MRLKKHCPKHPDIELDPVYYRNKLHVFARFSSKYVCHPPFGKAHLVNGEDALTPSIR